MSAPRRASRLLAALIPLAAFIPLAVLPAFLLTGCMVGPKYVRPTVQAPPAFKEPLPVYKEDGPWHTAQPADEFSKGDWWLTFHDDGLNELEPQIATANQTLRQADANLQAARAQIRINHADLYPTIGAAPFAGGTRLSGNRPYAGTILPGTGFADYQLPGELNWEIDLFGRIRRTVNIAREETQATAGDLANTLLSLQAELATDYFELRAADAQRKLLYDTVSQYQDAVRVTNNRFVGGVSPKSDLTQAETQLEAAKVLASDIDVARAQFEHAIAVLIGKAPSELSLAMVPLATRPPVIPPGLPSELLERRPDIAAAERRTAEANERMGIARAAYFPVLNLAGSIGYESIATSSLFAASSFFYAVGPTLSQTIYENGRRRGASEQAVADFNGATANYRQVSLTAYQQVEDNLVALRILAVESEEQHQAVLAAQESQRIFNNRYTGGVDTYLQVITAQTLALDNERNEIDIQRRRMDASVLLIKALGGGWDVTQLPRN